MRQQLPKGVPKMRRCLQLNETLETLHGNMWITWEAKHFSREDIATSHTDVPEQVFVFSGQHWRVKMSKEAQYSNRKIDRKVEPREMW